MKITTANIKHSSYNEQHEIFVGTHTGSFKQIDVGSVDQPHKQKNLQQISSLNKFSRITGLNWGDDDQSELLVGRANKFVQVYDTITESFTSNVEMIDAPIVGLARYDGGRLVAATGTGKIQILSDAPTIIETGGKQLTQMRQCEVNRKLVATGGRDRENNLKIWDLDTQKRIFTSKNLPNDFLQLEVPIWDTDMSFTDETLLSTCSRYGYVRRYDTRAQRRPILEWRNDKEQMAYTCLAQHDDMVYVGTATGIVRAFDTRKLKVISHTYKGFTGSISNIGIDKTGKYLYSASLDRFVRVHDSESTALLYQCYVKSKATKILLREKKIDDLSDSDCMFLGQVADDDEEVEGEIEENGTNADDEKGSDPEYDDIFSNMQTVRDDGETNLDDDVDSNSDNDEQPSKSKKQKLNNKKKKKINKL